MYTQGQGENLFKYITPMDCTERLKVPLAHCWNKKRVFPDSVILKDKKGNTWLVKLRKVEDQVCFAGAGWLKFVKDNRLEPGYYLILLNDDDGPNNTNNVFSFLLFDSVTKRETGGFVGPSDILPSLQPSSSSFFPKESSVNKEEQEWKSNEFMKDFDVVADDDDDDDIVDVADDDVDDDDEEEEEEKEEDDDDDDRDEESPTDPCRGNTSCARPEENRRTRNKGTQKRDIYGNDIFRSGVIPWPKNPYFVFYMSKSRPNELHVPINVINDYRLHLPKKAMIWDPQGVEWETELHHWKDGRVLYRGGLASFKRVNHVQDDEPCVCEFVYRDGGAREDLTLHVYQVFK